MAAAILHPLTDVCHSTKRGLLIRAFCLTTGRRYEPARRIIVLVHKLNIETLASAAQLHKRGGIRGTGTDDNPRLRLRVGPPSERARDPAPRPTPMTPSFPWTRQPRSSAVQRLAWACLRHSPSPFRAPRRNSRARCAVWASFSVLRSS